MRTYVINLPRETARRAAMEAQLHGSGLDYRFVDAVDGRQLSAEDRATLVDDATVARYPWWLTAGMIGAMLSHRAVFAEIATACDGPGLVLEDDAILSPNLAEVVDAMAQLVPPGGVFLLNFRSLKPCRLSRTGALRVAGHELLSPVDHRQPLSGLAYLLGEQAAERMAQVSVPVRWAPDSWASYVDAGALDSIRCALPRPVMPSRTVRSSTRHDGAAAGPRERLSESWPARVARQANRRRVAWLMNRVELVD